MGDRYRVVIVRSDAEKKRGVGHGYARAVRARGALLSGGAGCPVRSAARDQLPKLPPARERPREGVAHSHRPRSAGARRSPGASSASRSSTCPRSAGTSWGCRPRSAPGCPRPLLLAAGEGVRHVRVVQCRGERVDPIVEAQVRSAAAGRRSPCAQSASIRSQCGHEGGIGASWAGPPSPAARSRRGRRAVLSPLVQECAGRPRRPRRVEEGCGLREGGDLHAGCRRP